MNLYDEIITILYLIVFQFKTIFLYWFGGVLAGSAVSIFAAGKIGSLLGRAGKKRCGLLAAAPAALLGAASPVCMYGTVPLIAALGRKGVPQHLLASFMVSSILINPNLFIFGFALGAPIALARLGLSLLAGILAGLLTMLFFSRKPLFDFNGFEETEKCDDGSKPAARFLKSVHRGIVKTAPYFLLGILLTALFERYFPKDLIFNLFGSNTGVQGDPGARDGTAVQQ